MSINLESELEKYFAEIKESTKRHVDEIIGNAYTNLLPYVVDDTDTNAGIQAQDIVNQLLSGNFIFDGDYAVVSGVREYAPRIRIAFTAANYDSLRDRIIERMPRCPKDKKIEQLENEIERLRKIGF